MNLTFELEPIRVWAFNKGILTDGDPKTQALKLVEEVGELAKAIIEGNRAETKDGLGDCVVVLTSLAHLCGFTLEHCVNTAYAEIANRKGQMQNGTFVKDKPAS